MSTRVKLFLSYLVMGFLPIILLTVVMVGFMVRIVTNSPFLVSLKENQESVLEGVDSLLDLEILTRNNQEELYDRDLLSDAANTLASYHIGIILLDSNQQIFYASSFLNTDSLMADIRYAEQNPMRSFVHDPIHPMGYQRLNTQSDFMIFKKALSKEQGGTLYLAVETGPTKQITKTYFDRFMFIVFFIMTGIILLMTLLVTRSMMQSLKKLKAGVRHISEGDLSFSIQTNKRDEVAQVVMAFEEMRIRLKASIDAQVKEDENRKELVANISHDLKTPVTAIKGYVEGLIDGVADTPEKKEKYLSTILSKTISLDRMIDDLFLYSSLDVGRTAYHYETLAADGFFESLCSETKLDLTERGFDVSCSLQIPQNTRIRVDRQMIHRLQRNLTENASKYCRADGRKVIFTAVLQGKSIVCSTEDNGTGIHTEDLPHIFERFYRADAARTSTIGGTGLGLQISRRIIEDHGGKIRAESCFGEYTRISWTLPVLAEEGVEHHG